MYLYYLLGWKLMTKYYGRWQKGEDESKLKAEVEVRQKKWNTFVDFGFDELILSISQYNLNVKQNKLCLIPQKEKQNTYLLALDGDTDFQPAAVTLLIDRLKMYPRVGAACGRIHPTGSGWCIVQLRK